MWAIFQYFIKLLVIRKHIRYITIKGYLSLLKLSGVLNTNVAIRKVFVIILVICLRLVVATGINTSFTTVLWLILYTTLVVMKDKSMLKAVGGHFPKFYFIFNAKIQFRHFLNKRNTFTVSSVTSTIF